MDLNPPHACKAKNYKVTERSKDEHERDSMIYPGDNGVRLRDFRFVNHQHRYRPPSPCDEVDASRSTISDLPEHCLDIRITLDRNFVVIRVDPLQQ